MVSVGASYETLRFGETRGLPERSDYMSLTGGYIASGLGEAGRDVAHPGRGSGLSGPSRLWLASTLLPLQLIIVNRGERRWSGKTQR